MEDLGDGVHVDEDEIARRVDERPDLLERFAAGDIGALVRLMEHATGAKAASYTVTLAD